MDELKSITLVGGALDGAVLDVHPDTDVLKAAGEVYRPRDDAPATFEAEESGE